MATKKLIILRACNELLKRLSRAEDTVFCGRVFIYLFESLAFGDRSAVNLRGEFHVDNVTSYEETENEESTPSTEMEVDPRPTLPGGEQSDGAAKAADAETDIASTTKAIPNGSKTTSQLYPLFWSLQKYFCKPTTLFDPANLAAFKDGLKETLTKFKEVQKDSDARGGAAIHEDAHPTLKRKWEEANDGNDTFNPKYLTSRDLFELEVRLRRIDVG